MPHERRHFVRVGFDAPALLTTATAAFSVHVLDLSLKGALIMVPAQAALGQGTLCQLTIPLADTGNHIAMSTEVAHVQGLHTGLLCKGIDLDSVTHLRRLIELQLGDPALLERDLGELTMASAAH
ncbi:PilZ domain-containing protein [Acidovorax sp. ST3]|uniref:PilZ domain-containing protein n=1 Tax=Acidovorax sp. ST3 TaxID=2219062 RepID=UPI000DA6B6D6|nr:PilZ domain-containing protein [Acidovorax sp. ST3]